MDRETLIKSYVGEARVLDFYLNLGTIENYLDLVAAAIESDIKLEFYNHNLHTLYLYYKDRRLRELYKDSVVVLDGMPFVWLLKAMGYPARKDHRVTYAQFIWPLLQRANEEGWRVFYVGASSDIQQAAFRNIRARWPDIRLTGHHGYFDISRNSPESRELVKQINDFNTDLCIVGMGTPRQEYWVGDHRDNIDAPAVMFSGACIEYVAGHVGTPPSWMGTMGLEWSYRLIENPRRFAFRYLVEPWVLATMILAKRFNLQR